MKDTGGEADRKPRMESTTKIRGTNEKRETSGKIQTCFRNFEEKKKPSSSTNNVNVIL